MSDAYFEACGVTIIYSKLTGVTFDGRQTNIRQCKECDTLNLIREPDNQYDPNAIRVEDAGRILGYIPRDQAITLATYMDAGGEIINCFINQITGGGDLNLGLNIIFLVKNNYVV